MKEFLPIIKIAFLNFILGGVKIFLGILTFSQSLIIDGIDSIIDGFNNFIGFFALVHSRKSADDEHPYGHGNSEYIASLVLSMIIIFTAFLILKSMINGTFIIESDPKIEAILIIIISFIIKSFVAIYLLNFSKVKKNKLLKTMGIENLLDLPKSLRALIGISLAVNGIGFETDIIAGALISILIAITGVKLLMDSYNNLLGVNTDKEYIEYLKEKINKEDILNINYISAVERGPYLQVLIAICINKNLSIEEGHKIAKVVKLKLLEEEIIQYVTVHVDPSKE